MDYQYKIDNPNQCGSEFWLVLSNYTKQMVLPCLPKLGTSYKSAIRLWELVIDYWCWSRFHFYLLIYK